MESGFISVMNMGSGAEWQPMVRKGSGRYEFFKVRHFGALHFVKRPSEAYRNDLVTVESLKKEFYIGYNLNHPSIARYIRMEDGAVYEEYVDGLSIREMIDNDDERLRSPEFVERVCRRLIEAAAYLHSRGVIHNDIKPENVMISRIDNQLKLVDLGCATTDMWDATEGYTPAYKAPEQGVGDTNVYTDVFLTGRLVEELAAKAGVSRRWRRFVKKATAEDISDRFASDDEALASLPTKRNSGKWMVFCLAGLFLLTGSIGYYARLRGEAASSPAASVDSLWAGNPRPEIRPESSVPEMTGRGIAESAEPVSKSSIYGDTFPVAAADNRTVKDRIDDELLLFATDLYNRRIIPQCEKRAKYTHKDDVEVCDIRIIRKTKAAESEILNHAEALALEYPDHADYCRMQASVVIDAQNRRVNKIIDDNPPILQPLDKRPLWQKLKADLDGEHVYYISDLDNNPALDTDQWNWMNDNCRYPENAKKKGIEGIVTVGFVVKKDGSVDRVTILKGLDKEIDESVVKTIRNMPKWTPGKIKGEPVNYVFERDLFFELPDE